MWVYVLVYVLKILLKFIKMEKFAFLLYSKYKQDKHYFIISLQLVSDFIFFFSSAHHTHQLMWKVTKCTDSCKVTK